MSGNRNASLLTLGRSNFDPIFSDEFFKEPIQKEGELLPVKFPLPPGNSEKEFAEKLQEFLESPEGLKFKMGVSDIVQQIKSVIEQWKIDKEQKERWIKNLDDFYQKRFAGYSGLDPDVNKSLYSLYKEGVENLYNFLQKIQDDSLSLLHRQTVAKNLLDKDDLERCGPGTSGFIGDSYKQLATNSAEALAAARHVIALQLADSMHRNLDMNKPDHARGMEVHYARYFVYSYAHALGVKESWDIYFSSLREDKVFKLFESCIRSIRSAMTLENIIVQLLQKFNLTEILQDLQNKLKELSKEDVAIVFTNYYEVTTERLKESLDQFGLDEDWVNFFELEFSDVGDLSVQLKPDAQETLKISLINRLFNSGYLDQKQRMEIKLPNGDVLYLLFGNSERLSYVKSEKYGGSYSPFESYYEKLSTYKKAEVCSLLFDKLKHFTADNERVALINIIFMVDNTGKYYLKMLEDQIIDAKAKLQDDKAPIHVAAQKGYLDAVRYLASKVEGTLSQSYTNGSTAIHFAAQGGSLAVVQYLVEECQVPFDEPNREGHTPLWFAAKYNEIDTVKYFIEHGAVLNENDYEVLLELALKDIEICLYLIKNSIIGAHTKIKNDEPLIVAVAGKPAYIDVLKYLAKDKKMLALTSSVGNTVMHYAAAASPSAVHYLVEECQLPVNITNLKGHSPLWLAAINIRIDNIKYLIEHGAVLNEEDKEILRDLAFKDNDFCLYLLKNNIIRADLKSRHDLPLFLVAAMTPTYIDVFRYLSNDQSTLNIVDRDGLTAMHYAAAGSLSVVRYLVEQCHLSVNESNEFGLTPLWVAAALNEIGVVKYLIDHNADVNPQILERPSILARGINRDDICDVLLIAGAKLKTNEINEIKFINDSQKNKVALFMDVPNSIHPKNKESPREICLDGIRQRTMNAFNPPNDDAIKNAKKEIERLNKLEYWNDKIRSVIQITPQTQEALRNKLNDILLVIEGTYLIFNETKDANKAISYLKTNCAEIVKTSDIFATKTSSSIFSKSYRSILQVIFTQIANQSAIESKIEQKKSKFF